MKIRGTTEIPDFSNMTETEFIEAVEELCAAGLLTCTRGTPGADGATYALAWMPLDKPETFPTEVRERHAANMLRISQAKGSS